jgi:hypothetical protein
MSYAGSRRIIDADSHLIELEDFVANAADPLERSLIPPMEAQQILHIGALSPRQISTIPTPIPGAIAEEGRCSS